MTNWFDAGTTPRSERANTTLRDLREGKRPGTLDEALREALRDPDPFAVVIVNLTTGESRTAFVM